MCYFCTLTKEKDSSKCLFRESIPKIINNKQLPGIDNCFKWEEIEYPVMKGTDILDRPFIILKLIIGKLNVKVMQCFFFGYSWGRSIGFIGSYDNQGNNNNEYNLILTEGGMNLEQYNLIKCLVNGECVKLKEDHKLISDEFVGHYIQLYDKKKWEAAKIIQKYWRICRYNPEYKLCSIVQNNNFNEIYKETIDNIN